MAPKKQAIDPNMEVSNLLRKLLALQLFAAGASQGAIAKKLKMNINSVNELLKGIKKNNAPKTAKRS
jgi:DNA-binding transcriptional regulator LsrR (DeoR family)